MLYQQSKANLTIFGSPLWSLECILVLHSHARYAMLIFYMVPMGDYACKGSYDSFTYGGKQTLFNASSNCSKFDRRACTPQAEWQDAGRSLPS